MKRRQVCQELPRPVQIHARIIEFVAIYPEGYRFNALRDHFSYVTSTQGNSRHNDSLRPHGTA